MGVDHALGPAMGNCVSGPPSSPEAIYKASDSANGAAAREPAGLSGSPGGAGAGGHMYPNAAAGGSTPVLADGDAVSMDLVTKVRD